MDTTQSSCTTRDFLFEIGTEEMPSAPLNNAVRQLEKLTKTGLSDVGLSHGAIQILSSPRRLAIYVHEVAEATQAVHETKRGPAASIAFDADGAPTKAAQGFARKCGITTSELIVRVDSDGREYVFAERSVDSVSAGPLLSQLAEHVMASLEWPNYRSQRWGSTHESFVRPIRWLCALFGNEPLHVNYADVTSAPATRGHRVLAPGTHTIATASAYEQVLAQAYVQTAQQRVSTIRDGISRVEHELDVHVDTPKKVFDEVVNLCEWPTVLVGHFDESYLKIPHEIICESMLTNQRYFPCYDKDGVLTRAFVVISNADPDVSDTVIDGNERVVRARLDDAKFFYEEDLKQPLEAYLPQLEQVTFQDKLGSVYQKATRMERLSGAVAHKALKLDDTMVHEAERAALLAKADLVTQAVVEFTSQQGVMGGYYAHAAGEPDEVAHAIRDQYRPRFAGDALPEGPVGIAVAVADKLDTVCGMFVIDQPPTGSSDPFAVRRSAIGIIAMLREAPGQAFTDLISCALTSYADQGLLFDAESCQHDILDFFAGRMATIAKDEGIAPDTIEAVRAAGVIDPAEFFVRAHALEHARAKQPELFDDLATAYARASHLAQPELGCDVNESLLVEQERVLLKAVDATAAAVNTELAQQDYASALTALASLREPIDRFFTDVLVMDDNPAVRDNHLRLLNRFSSVFQDIADMGMLARTK